jgi:hypothetical protein
MYAFAISVSCVLINTTEFQFQIFEWIEMMYDPTCMW